MFLTRKTRQKSFTIVCFLGLSNDEHCVVYLSDAPAYWDHTWVVFTKSCPRRSSRKWRWNWIARWLFTTGAHLAPRKCRLLSSLSFCHALHRESQNQQFESWFLFNFLLVPRRGGPALKRSQVYPLRYGRKFQKLHCDWVAPRLWYILGMKEFFPWRGWSQIDWNINS